MAGGARSVASALLRDPRVDPETRLLARRVLRGGRRMANPERAAFRKAHPELLEFYGALERDVVEALVARRSA